MDIEFLIKGLKFMEKENLHLGRRDKLRQRFINFGLESFNECEILEFAMTFCLPRIDTNPIAHNLIKKFGNMQNVIDSNPLDLQQVTGIGQNCAVFLSFLKQFVIENYKKTEIVKIICREDAIKYLEPIMKQYLVEQLVILLLDNAGKVLLIETITNNELSKVCVNMREIIAKILRVRTAKVILAHNHLNDSRLPSNSDISLTRQLTHILGAVDVDLLDHLIFSGDGIYSFHDSGMLGNFKKEYLEIRKF
ncbi:MAG: hypothetical protein LBH47_01080 [Christensenellaceae bacterium]|jgi:DNA repair protein RadC|nr:hypothetical protein [Christensenellaceae bacterium]